MGIALALAAKTRKLAILYWVLLALVVLSIVGTQSRGATLGLAAVLGYLWLQSPHKFATLAAIFAVAFAIILYAPGVYFERLSTITKYQEESSAEGRVQAWEAGTRMGISNFLGVGAGNFPNNYPKYRSSDAPIRWITAHSMYFLVFGELGILGLLVLLRLLFGNMRQNTKVRRWWLELKVGDTSGEALVLARTLYMLNAIVVGFAIAGAFLSVSYYPHVFVLTGLMLSARSLATSGAAPEQDYYRESLVSPRRSTGIRKRKQNTMSCSAMDRPPVLVL
jgi:hypothetical protein